MNRQELISLIADKKSFLCVGLDTDPNKIPQHLKEESSDPIFAFNKAIIDATIDFTVAYKPNVAFYEAMGIQGLISLQKTIDYLNSLEKKVFTIADAKRGDIGNTSQQYAQAFLSSDGDFNFDALTVAPYMGEDSVSPFTIYKDKWAIILALTSNKGATDFQFIRSEHGKQVYEIVLEKSQTWASTENTMYVCGATQAEMFANIRKIIPEHFLLVPGIGAQGGSLAEVCQYGLNRDCGLLVNSSRGIIYADSSKNFADRAHLEAQKLQKEMSQWL